MLDDDDVLEIAPIRELETLREELLCEFQDARGEAINRNLESVRGRCLEIRLEVPLSTGGEIGVEVLRTPNGREATRIGLRQEDSFFFVDRSRSSFDPNGRGGVQGGLLACRTDRFCLTVFVDQSMVEAYANNSKCITSRAYPIESDADGVRLFGLSDSPISCLQIWRLAEIL